MVKFVLAGRADCPYYAKAELFADSLQRNLPNFRIHKICLHPKDWQQWLKTTCDNNGWKHDHSPIVWRELIDRGGKGLLLGGFSDFLEHVQGYYGITSDITTEKMLEVAVENLHTKEVCMEEEAHYQSLIHPLHVWVSSALNPTCYNLIPLLLGPALFQDDSTVSLHLLDVEGSEEALKGLQMEAEDLASPQLQEMTIHTTLERAFLQAKVVIFLDEQPAEKGGVETSMRRVVERYRAYGRLIDSGAHRGVRVVVAGSSFTCLKCSVLLENAPSLRRSQFVAMATQLEKEATAVVAHKLNVKPADVRDVMVWGNISGCSHVDLQRALVFQYEGAVWGPAGFSQPVLEIIYDRKWLESDFQSMVKSRRNAVVSKMQRSAALSEANGIVSLLRSWSADSTPGEVFSLGVFSTGQYGIPAGLVFSMPLRFHDGGWAVLPDISIHNQLREQLQIAASELRAEKEMASNLKDQSSAPNN